MPADVVPVTEAVFNSMTEARSRGQRLTADEDGQPKTLDRLPPTTAQLAEGERVWRDGEISRTEWLVARHRDELDMGRATTITAGMFIDLMSYRQLLRDWPSAAGFPKASRRPQWPDWLVAVIEAR